MTTRSQGKYSVGLDQTAANFVQLSPLSFLKRTAAVYPDLTSAVYEDRRFTWAETHERCCRLAAYLMARGIKRGDTVAAMLPNIPAMNEAHFGVPMSGAVLNTLNIRLEPASIAFQLDHGGAKVILVDPEFSAAVAVALTLMTGPKPDVIDVDDAAYAGGQRIGDIEYEAALASADLSGFAPELPDDEWDAIALSYTSGTTGNPKGVVTHHRGAYLNAVSNVLAGNLGQHPVYLWTLPMFHCNGWCFPWTIALTAGVNVCLRKVDPTRIFDLITRHGVTHMSGAPIVYNTLINAPDAPKASGRFVTGLIAGAAPPMAVLSGAENIGIRLTHVYGLTEVYGPASVCAEQPGWDDLPSDERAQLKRRQGVPYPLQEAVSVLDPATMQEVPRDGETIGEVMFRGNIVMKGYLNNEKATQEAFAGGWFHTGDLGVLDKDGYVIIKDRSKDIIISGGENISSVEVEDILYKHPAVLFAAVVARPDGKWGEVPCAFVELKENAKATEADIIAFCRTQMPGFKAPKSVVFGIIPKTSTGKIQKFMLRDQVKSASAIGA